MGEFKTEAQLAPELQPHDGRTVSVQAALPGPGRRWETARDSGEQAGVDALGRRLRGQPPAALASHGGSAPLLPCPLPSSHVPSHLSLPAGPLSSPECPASTLPTPHSFSLCTSGLRTSSCVPKPFLKGRQHVLSYICLECRASK